MVSVLLSALVERFGVSRMRNFFQSVCAGVGGQEFIFQIVGALGLGVYTNKLTKYPKTP